MASSNGSAAAEAISARRPGTAQSGACGTAQSGACGVGWPGACGTARPGADGGGSGTSASYHAGRPVLSAPRLNPG